MMFSKTSVSVAFLGLALALLPSCSQNQSTAQGIHTPSGKIKVLGEEEMDSKKVAKAAQKTRSNGFLPAPVCEHLQAESVSRPTDKHGMPSYPLTERRRVVRTTAYSHMEKEPGAPGRLTAIGTTLAYGKVRSAAADWSVYPVGTRFKIKGLPHTYVVDDYGSALVGTNTIDIFHPTLSLMRRWGTRPAEITVTHWGSWERTLKVLSKRTKYRHCRAMYLAARKRVEAKVALQRTQP